MRLSEQIRTKLRWKMTVGFLALSLLPCLLVTGIYSFINYRYYAKEQEAFILNVLSQYCKDVEDDFHLCESMYQQIYQSNSFLQFLDGEQKTTAEQLVSYLKEYSTMFSSIEQYSPHVDSIKVYMMREDRLKMGRYLYSIDALGDYELDKKTSQGYWRYEEKMNSGQFIFRRTIMNRNLTYSLGILEICCSPTLFTEKIQNLSAALNSPVYAVYDDVPYLISDSGSLVLAEAEELSPETALDFEFSGLPLAVCIDRAAGHSIKHSVNPVTLTALASIIFILSSSVLYFLWVSRLSRRIKAFTDHISASYPAAPPPYTDQGHDEFSQLIQQFNEMLENNSQLVSQIKLEQLRQSEMKYKVLQAQIDPHFIFNSLENIRMLADEHGDEESAEMIVSLSRLLRYSFSFRTGEVTLYDEMDLVAQYLKIQKLRWERWLEYELSCPEELYSFSCPQFIIQPLVENAIKYGMEKPERILFVTVQVLFWEGKIRISVENTGKALPEDKLEQINSQLKAGKALNELSTGTGIGLDSINNRMRWLYPQSFEMELQPLDSGLRVVLTWDPKEPRGEELPNEMSDRG